METMRNTKSRSVASTKYHPVDTEISVGKLPPQAIEIEEAVLGAIMLEKDALTSVIEILKSDMFYKMEHQLIFTAIKQLFADSKPIDILTVTNQLKFSGDLDVVGGAAYIASLTNHVASSANTEYHSRIIIEKYIQRKLIEVSSETIKLAYEDTSDVLDLLDSAQNKLFQLTEENFHRGVNKMTDIIGEAIEAIEVARKQSSGGLSGVPSGFLDIDSVTGGWQKSDLIILAARPGMGKTAFALTMARNMAVDFDRPVAVFSLEMSAVQLVTRLISSETEIPADILRRGQITDEQWQNLSNKITTLSKAKIFIDDTAGLTVFELRAKCRKLKAEYDIQFVVIDYLQLMTLGNERERGTNREQEISNISRSLKALAKELEIPILALSQLSRDVEKRGGDKKPVLSDLRESGAIEQDADIVMFIFRPGYYQKDSDREGEAEINIAKHRNGTLADIKVKFISQFAKFVPTSQHSSIGKDDDDGYDVHNFKTFQSRMNDSDDFANFGFKNDNNFEDIPF